MFDRETHISFPLCRDDNITSHFIQSFAFQSFPITMVRLLSLPIASVCIVAQAAITIKTSVASPLQDSPNTIDTSSSHGLPSTRIRNDAILNHLKRLADGYPTFVTVTTTQKLFGVGDGLYSYALIIQDKQGGALENEDHQQHNKGISSSTQLLQPQIAKDAIKWFRHSIHDDDSTRSVTDQSNRPTKEGIGKEEGKEVPTIAGHGDIILSAATLGAEKVVGLADLMLEAAKCKLSSSSVANDRRKSIDGVSGNSNDAVGISNNNANYILSTFDCHPQCLANLHDRGVSTKDMEWLAYLVFTRKTIVLVGRTGGDTVSPHSPHAGRFNVFWLVVACVGLLLTVAFISALSVRRRKHRTRMWLEEEAQRRVARVDNSHVYCSRKDVTSDLTSFDEELVVQLIQPSYNLILV